MHLLSFALMLAYLAIILNFVKRSVYEDRAALALALLVSPFCVIQLSYDIARADGLLLVSFYLCHVWVIHRRYLAAMLLTLVSVLLHEMFLVFAVPSLFAMYVHKEHGGLRAGDFLTVLTDLRLVAAGVVCVGLGLALFLFGGIEYDPKTMPVVMAVIWERSFFSPALGKSGVETVIFLALIGAIWTASFLFLRKNAGRAAIVFLAAASSLALFAFGIDSPRWLAVYFMATVLLMIVLHLHEGHVFPRLSGAFAVALLSCAIPLGPAGQHDIFPYVQEALRVIARP